jgi:hypothetical protein
VLRNSALLSSGGPDPLRHNAYFAGAAQPRAVEKTLRRLREKMEVLQLFAGALVS